MVVGVSYPAIVVEESPRHRKVHPRTSLGFRSGGYQTVGLLVNAISWQLDYCGLISSSAVRNAVDLTENKCEA